MGRIVTTLIIVVDVLVIMDILRNARDTERKILWILAVLFLPLLGPVLYYVLGRD